MGYVYVIKNELSNKIYVGQTTQEPYKRFAGHLLDIDRRDIPLYRDIKELGINFFRFQVIETVQDELLNEREFYWINYFDSLEHGYNGAKPPSEESQDSIKGILVLKQFSKDGKFIKTFKTAKAAAVEIFPDLEEKEQAQKAKHISDAARGVKASAYGFKWKKEYSD